MANYIETNLSTAILADDTPCQLSTYDEYDDQGNLVAEAQMESQLYINPNWHCWHISSISALQAATTTDYFQPNAAGALPKPKGIRNPGGSPVKY